MAADLEYFTTVLGGEVGFAIDGMGARVALVRMTGGPPHVLLTDHLGDERPIFIYRVGNLKAALAGLKARGWKKAQTLEIPMGPCCSFETPGGQRIAIYELTRPQVAEHFLGRRDF